MLPLCFEPPPHWCSHFRRSCAGFLSGHPEFLASPPRFAPSSLCSSLTCSAFRYGNSFSLYNFAHSALLFIGQRCNLGVSCCDGLYHYGKEVNAHSAQSNLDELLSLAEKYAYMVHLHHIWSTQMIFLVSVFESKLIFIPHIDNLD